MKRAFASILASAMMLFALAGCSGGGETTPNETQIPHRRDPVKPRSR